MGKARIPELEEKVKEGNEIIAMQEIEINRLKNRLDTLYILMKSWENEELEEAKRSPEKGE